MTLDRIVPAGAAALAVLLVSALGIALVPALAAGQALTSPADIGVTMEVPRYWDVLETPYGLAIGEIGDEIMLEPFVVDEGEPTGEDRVRAYLLRIGGFDGGSIHFEEPREIDGFSVVAAGAFDGAREMHVRDIYVTPTAGLHVVYATEDAREEMVALIDSVRVVDTGRLLAVAARMLRTPGYP